MLKSAPNKVATAADEIASFEVTGHYQMASRGAFVIGHIRTGGFRPGMQLIPILNH
jgi:hypothetical protein